MAPEPPKPHRLRLQSSLVFDLILPSQWKTFDLLFLFFSADTVLTGVIAGASRWAIGIRWARSGWATTRASRAASSGLGGPLGNWGGLTGVGSQSQMSQVSSDDVEENEEGDHLR